MRKTILQLIVSFAMVFCSSTVHSKAINMSFCDVGTSCQRCSETVVLLFEQVEKSVFMSGEGVDGKYVKESLSNCNFTSNDYWTCSEVRMRISSESGQISANLLKDMSVSGRKQEVCVIQ